MTNPRTLLAVALLAFVIAAAPLTGFFVPDPGLSGNRVIITRMNNYETLALTQTNSYDLGDTNAAITARYGGDPTKAFASGWPISLYVHFSPAVYPWVYTGASLQYLAGTNSGSDTNWVTFAHVVSNDMQQVQGVPGAYFGLVTWYPPVSNNTDYLIRVIGTVTNTVTNGMSASSGNPDGIGIDSKGGGGWINESVLGLRATPNKRPGFSPTPVYRMIVSKSGNGSVQPLGTNYFAFGTRVWMQATPASNSTFIAWAGVTNAGVFPLVILSDTNLSAVFFP